MTFNSIDFALFVPIVFAIYWLLGSRIRLQNLLIVIASYVFYGWWDWTFLSLILLSTIVDFWVGLGLANQDSPGKRKALLWTSILVNIGVLGFFKYFNFFVDNFVAAFSFFGLEISTNSLDIILPVGISFYTFQTMSYTIDVYRGKLEATRDFIAFSAFVSFFPQLVAGPIERATHLLPQFTNKRSFDYACAADGMRQILWGLFKKTVIADNCAEFCNSIFNHSADMSGGTLVLGAIFFSLQIYSDFSGYSDIAIGTARLFGFDLNQNFAFPYFSRDIAEFWRRWHISLSTWFRDYVYIPLGGSRGSLANQVRNIFIIFVVSGFWHGANWTFIVWGGLNALYFLPLLLTKNNRRNLDVVAAGKWLPSLKESFLIVLTFSMTLLAWIFFRAENLSHALSYLSGIATNQSGLTPRQLLASDPTSLGLLGCFVALLLACEWLNRDKKHGLQIDKLPAAVRWTSYLLLASFMILFAGSKTGFIYFQF